jgi:radical SAM protein with 4Fe4S-binding SPASM domain
MIHSGAGKKVGNGLEDEELQAILDVAVQKTESHGQRLIWYTPTQYCRFDPTLSNLGVKGCTAALYSMCIESNGDVIPCQSTYRSLGNFQTNPWENIWNHPLSRQLRERHNLPAKCNGCPIVSECGGGCPLKKSNQPDQWSPCHDLRQMGKRISRAMPCADWVDPGNERLEKLTQSDGGRD